MSDPTPFPTPAPTPPPTPTAPPLPTPPPTPPSLPLPVAYYDCQCPGDLRDLSGNGLAIGYAGSPGLVAGICHDGRSTSAGNWFVRASATVFNPGSYGP